MLVKIMHYLLNQEQKTTSYLYTCLLKASGEIYSMLLSASWRYLSLRFWKRVSAVRTCKMAD